MFSNNNSSKKSLFGNITCAKCGKELNKDENITIKVNTKDLTGYTLLSSWAAYQFKYCEACSKQ
ncbi:hypothetical protein [Staphylococcus saccharolyticus]|uniref:hypothetical protein n=1 Tax=Staphylococcus saccharolyticus TaxID=33028 RepID=UPI0032DE92B4